MDDLRGGERTRPVTETEHLWIPMPDGTRLAARLWLPEGAGPVPAILEAIPYRKRDMVRARDERTHPVFARHGYASLRLDMRGSGDSEGVMADMYDPDELADTRHAIDWIAAQPWCDGRIGMFGTSWGGTASLQAAVASPGPLKAVIAVCATHDRYEDDIHHMGGCLLTDSLEWGATLPAILALPPSEAVGPDWMERWRARLDAVPFPVERWLAEEGRGAYWRHGSVRWQAERIDVPVLAVGGWSDRYSSSVMSLAALRPDLVRGIVGPWGHHYPDMGHPGPAMGFQRVALDWWDRWLRGMPGAEIPSLRLWRRTFDPPADALHMRSGGWIETDGAASDEVLHATAQGLGVSGDGHAITLAPDLRQGQDAGDTGYFGRFGGLPPDQAREDVRAVSLDAPPQEAPRDVLGAARLRLTVTAAPPRAQLVARLCDVAPDGRSCRIALAVPNLALDDPMDGPAPALPRTLEVTFPTTAYRLAPGHRLRLSLGTGHWPMIWPAPDLAPVTVRDVALHLPRPAASPAPLASALPPAGPPEKPCHEARAAPALRRWSETHPDGTLVQGWHQPESVTFHPDIATTFAYETRAEHALHPDDPLSARSTFVQRLRIARADGTAEIESTLTTTATADHWLPSGHLVARWNGATVHERRRSPRVPRRRS